MQEQVNTEQVVQLPSQVTEHIDRWLEKFPHDQRQSAVIESLRAAQEYFDGWLSVPVMQAVADYLGMPAIAVYEVASFYEMFETAPVGQHTVAFCTGIACMLRGVDEVVAHTEQALGIKLGQTTADAKVSLREVQCMGACDGAPMCQINHQHYHLNLDCQQVDTLLDALQHDRVPQPAAISTRPPTKPSSKQGAKGE